MNITQKEFKPATDSGDKLVCGLHPRRRAFYFALWPATTHVAPNFNILGDLLFKRGSTVVGRMTVNVRCQYDAVTGCVGMFRGDLTREPGFLSPFFAYPQQQLTDARASADALLWFPPNSQGEQMLVIEPHYTDMEFDSVEIVAKPVGLSLVVSPLMGTILMAVKDF